MTVNFIAEKLLKKLGNMLVESKNNRNTETSKLGDVFGDPFLLSKTYIQPNCQHHNPSDYDEDETRSLIQTPVSNVINSFLNGKYTVRDGRNQLFVLSDAGMGKTSLLLMLKLLHLYKFWPSTYNCKLLKLGKNTIDNIKEIKAKKDTVLLLDALDEDSEAHGNISKRIIQLLDITKKFKCVIITCRTQFFPDTGINPFGDAGRVIVEGYICPMIFISLFSDEQVTQYLNKKYKQKLYYLPKQRKAQKEKIAQSEHILSKMGSLRMRPLLLSHIDDLLDADVPEWNDYNVYKALIEVWLLREQRKLQEVYPDKSKIPNQSDLLDACVYLSEYMQIKGTRHIESIEIHQLLKEFPSLSYLKQFKLGGRSLLNLNSDGDYRFSHYSIQEYLLANGIIRKIIPRNGEKIRVTDQLVRFLEVTYSISDIFKNHLDLSDFNLRSYIKSKGHQKTNFTGLDFSNKDLSGLKLLNYEMEGINLEGADLTGSNLSYCNLINANLSYANLTKTNFQGANLYHADFSNSIISGTTNFRGSNIKHANFSHTNVLSGEHNSRRWRNIVQ